MAAHRNRLRVRVRSFVDNHVLRFVSEREARVMCAENADGSPMLGTDGKELEPVAWRLSRLKAPLADIQLKARERAERPSQGTIPFSVVENNAFVKSGQLNRLVLNPKDGMRMFDRAEQLIEAWPETYDDRNVIICAGRVHGARFVESAHLAAL